MIQAMQGMVLREQGLVGKKVSGTFKPGKGS